ncbi:MAG: PA0069 family radical SAM protein [Alphaproteobacteria bacterium]
MDELSPTSAGALKGRGAITNEVGRFEGHDRVAVDDGWSRDDEDLPPLRTSVTVDATRTIIARNDSPDIPFDQSINPYRGCEHGCVYCFARPTHAYLGLSPGLDFETRLFAKPDAAKLLERELRSPRYECRMIAMGTNTDPYQPIERNMKVTRSILEVLSAYSHPVGIVTKSALVARDIDILAPMAARGLAQVYLSVTTLDPELARRMEPRAAAPWRRIETIKALANAGIPVGVMTAPMIPALNDKEMETILETAAEAGAKWAGYVVLRMPLEIKDLFREWLEAHYPDKAKHVLNLIRDMRDGKLNSAEFGNRMRGNGAYADLIARRFALAVKRLNLNRERFRLDTTQFAPPPRAGDQLSLL